VSRGAWIIAAVIAVVAAVGAFVLATQVLGGGSNVSGGIDQCAIEADGTLTATGWVRSDDAIDATFDVRFDDANNNVEVDRDTVKVTAPAGQRATWTAQGKAGDKVTKVTCVLGPPH